jgi:2-polyprenyl-6-methoxyphenol hydroxylase-like FAD-dependent oxidoreductase
MQNVDVLIVGAGPSGLMLAGWLARSGIQAMVVDGKVGPTDETRAVGIQARTLELWDRLGITERALEQGRIAEGMNLWVRGRRVARIPIGEIGQGESPHPYIFLLGQDRTERLLLAHLEENGGAVRWQTELSALVQDGQGSVATLRHDGKETKVRARFVCGCDGARSAVRKAIGIEFAGGTYDSTFYVADVTARGGLVAGELNVGLFEDRFMAFFPLAEADRYRYIGLLPPGLQREDAKPEDVIPDAERLMGAKFEGVRWFSTYRVHHRVAAKFQEGRVFLVGDAGHVHSPVGAQGMNTGLQDAINLAWKLAEVLRYHADERLLKTYEEERLPFAQSLVKTTDRAFSGVISPSPLARLFRLRLAPTAVRLAGRLPVVRHALFGIVSQIGITYADSSLASGPGAGARMPWHPGRYKGERPDRWSLHMFGDEPAEAEPWARQHGMGIANWKGENPQTVLVRPDGYIGYSSPTFDPNALEEYLHKVIGRP